MTTLIQLAFILTPAVQSKSVASLALYGSFRFPEALSIQAGEVLISKYGSFQKQGGTSIWGSL